MKIEPGATLGEYEIRDPLGRGGMATVYRAYQPKLDREVAVKILASRLASAEDFRERFKREARAAAKLHHPNILPIHDFGELDDVLYLVTPLVTGGTLKDHLKDGSLSLKSTAQFLTQMCVALDYAHGQGYIHRDVKPANMLLDPDDHLFLTDFGIAKAVADTSGLTQPGMGVGTPEYMAPEQARGDASPASDLYGVGVILFQMLTGRVPFTGPAISVLVRQTKEPLPPASFDNPIVTPEMEAIIARATAKDPSQRYASARELSDAFLQAVTTAGAATSAQPSGPPPSPAAWTPNFASPPTTAPSGWGPPQAPVTPTNAPSGWGPPQAPVTPTNAPSGWGPPQAPVTPTNAPSGWGPPQAPVTPTNAPSGWAPPRAPANMPPAWSPQAQYQAPPPATYGPGGAYPAQGFPRAAAGPTFASAATAGKPSRIGIWIAAISAVLVLLCIALGVVFTPVLVNSFTGTPTPAPTQQALATASPANTTAPTIAPTPALSLLYSEDFSQPSHPWPSTSEVSVHSGYLQISDPSASNIASQYLGQAADNAVIQTHIELLQASAHEVYGVIFRKTDSQHFYAFLVDDAVGSYSFQKFLGGQWTIIVPWTSSSAIHQGVQNSNDITVAAAGGGFAFSINGVALPTSHDDSIASTGDIGIMAGSQNEVIGVQSIKVYQIQ